MQCLAQVRRSNQRIIDTSDLNPAVSTLQWNRAVAQHLDTAVFERAFDNRCVVPVIEIAQYWREPELLDRRQNIGARLGIMRPPRTMGPAERVGNKVAGQRL